VIPAEVAVASEVNSAVGHRWEHRGFSGILPADIRGFVAAFLGATSAAAGLLIGSRRLAGGITVGLSPGAMAAVMACMLAGVVACDWLVRPNGLLQSRRRRSKPLPAAILWSELLSRLGLWTAAWGLSGGGTSRAAMLIAMIAAGVAVLPLVARHLPAKSRLRSFLLQWRKDMASRWSPAVRPGGLTTHPARLPEMTNESQERPLLRAAELATAGIDEAGFLQQQTRRRTAAGEERVSGTVVVSFAVGDRIAIAHVGFCPPFPETPSVQLTTAYDELDAVVIPGEVLPWGIRVECRLEEAAEDPFDIPVDFVATAAGAATPRGVPN